MRETSIVRRPFNKGIELIGFIAILLLVLLSPLIYSSFLTLEPYQVYRSFTNKSCVWAGNYRFIGEKMEEGGEIDLLLIGGSNAHTSFNAKFLTEQLSAMLGRPVIIYNFGIAWYGAEVDFLKVMDALNTLSPKLILLPDADVGYYYPHELTHMIWRTPVDNFPDRISLMEQATLYGAAMLGAPRLIYASFTEIWRRPESACVTQSLDYYRASLGYHPEEKGWLSHYEPDREKRLPYKALDYTPPEISLDDMAFKGIEDKNFEFRSYSYNTYQSAFISKIAEISSEREVDFITVSIPTHFDEYGPNEKAWVRPLAEGYFRHWPHFGISMRQLFPEMTFDEMKRFYSDESHLNDSGAKVFNRALLPLLEDLLADD